MNLIQNAEKDNEIFKTTFPDERLNTAAYVDRIAEIMSFTGVIPAPKEDSNEATTELDIISFDKAKEMFDEMYSAYSSLEKEGFQLSYAISQLYLLSSGSYNPKTMRLNYAFDYTQFRRPLSSRATFVLCLLSSHITHKKAEVTQELKEKIKSFLFIVAKVFHPQVVAELFAALFEHRNIFLVEYSEEEFYPIACELYEALVMREGLLLESLGPKYYEGMSCVGMTDHDLVAYKLSLFVFKDPLDVLDDVNRHNWFNTIFNPSAYNIYRKSLYTNILLNMIESQGNLNFAPCDNKEGTFMDISNRYIREQVTDWIKHVNIEERPDQPDCYKYINISDYLKEIYSYALWNVTDMEAYVAEVEKDKEDTEAAYNEVKEKWDEAGENNKTKAEEELRKELHEKKEAKDIAYNKYLSKLKHKSLIAFLFEEIFSNEKMIMLSCSKDLLAFITAFEPDEDNSMHDTHNVVMSWLCKREIKELDSVSPINGFSIHANIGDVVDEETVKFTRIMSNIMNINLGSRIATAFINTPIELGNVLSALEYSDMKTKLCVADTTLQNIYRLIPEIDSFVDPASEYKEIYDQLDNEVKSALNILHDSLKEFNMAIPESRNDIVVYINVLKATVEKTNSIELVEKNLWWYPVLDTVRSELISYDSEVFKSNNILKVIHGIIQHLENKDILDHVNSDVNLGFRHKSFWPRYRQFEIEVEFRDDEVKPSQEVLHDEFIDIKPGDLQSGYYKKPYKLICDDDRFTTSKACD